MAHIEERRRAFAAILGDPLVAAVREEAGETPAHLTGGALRDLALGRAAPDLDFIVAAGGEAIADSVARRFGLHTVRLGGGRYRAWRLTRSGLTIDLWELDGTSLDADLWRRDLTVNALALDLRSGEVRDPTGGLADLERRRLRATRPAVFTEDPVRCLRLPRLALELTGFTVDQVTLAAARSAADRLPGCPSERLRGELEQILGSPSWSAAVAWILRLDLLPILLSPAGVGVARRLAAASEAVTALDEPLDRVGEETRGTEPAELALRWAFLAALGGNPPAVEASLLSAALEKGLLTRADFRDVERILAPGLSAPDGPVALRSWLHAAGSLWTEGLRLGRALDVEAGAPRRWDAVSAAISELSPAELEAILRPPLLLDGNEVRELLGIRPGPEVGAALARIRTRQIEGAIRSPEEAREFLLAMRDG
ncbi:MAG: hypothetical protein AB7G12_11570 [Thermoanaerobaculia bacterium]